MKISDIFENFNEDLRGNVIDVAMMFRSNGITKTSLNNFIIELDKRDFHVIIDDLIQIFSNLDGFEVIGDDVILDDSDTEVDVPDSVESEREYNPAASKAKSATKKRI